MGGTGELFGKLISMLQEMGFTIAIRDILFLEIAHFIPTGIK
jgi:hypothetical protein